MKSSGRSMTAPLEIAFVSHILLVSSLACQSGGYLADYTFQASAMRVSHETGPERETVVPTIAEMTFADDSVECTWKINDYGVRVELSDKTTHPISILWTEAGFRDEAGKEQRLFVSRAFEDKGASVERFDIDGQQRAEFWIFPWDYKTGNPPRALFVPPGYSVGKTSEEIVGLAAPVVGKTIRFEIPMVIGDARYDYTFTFTATKVSARGLRKFVPT